MHVAKPNANNASEVLFDLNRMAGELSRARNQLKERQLNSGAFSWFPGMNHSRLHHPTDRNRHGTPAKTRCAQRS